MTAEASNEGTGWVEQVYDSRARRLILYGRALGLSHAEAEDLVQEVFVRLLAMPEPPDRPDHYVTRAFRNAALNYRRSLWRRISREWESSDWFERAPVAGSVAGSFPRERFVSDRGGFRVE